MSEMPEKIDVDGPMPKKRWSRKQVIIAVVVGIPLMSCCCLMTWFQLFVAGTPQYKADMTASFFTRTARANATETARAKPPTNTPEPTRTQKPTNTPTPLPTKTPKPTNTPTPIPLGSTRDNPIPAGDQIDYGGGIVLTITEMVRPATDIVIRGNQFNTKPEKGQEYIQVKLHVECVKESSEKCSFSTISFKAVGADGNIRDVQWILAGVEGMLDSNDMFGGGKKEGNIFFIVPTGDETVVLFYDGIFSDPVYIGLPSMNEP